MSNDNVSFMDGEDFGGSKLDGISHRTIMMEQYRRIILLSNVEFRGGYWESKKIPMSLGGQMNIIENRVYVEDSREVFSNAIEIFSQVLKPHYDNVMKNDDKIHRNKMKSLWESKTVVIEQEREDLGSDTDLNDLRAFEDDSMKLSYRSERRKLCHDFFGKLCSFMQRKNYFEAGMIIDSS